jgi:hypothetical protein
MELPSSERRRARATLRVGWLKDQDSPNSPSMEQGEGNIGRAPCRTYGRTPWCQQDSRQGQTVVLLATLKEWCWEVVPTMWHLYSKPKSPNEEPALMCQYIRAPLKWIAIYITESFCESGGESVPPDCYGLPHQEARGLCHP